MLAKDFEIVIYYMLSLSKITNKKIKQKKRYPLDGPIDIVLIAIIERRIVERVVQFYHATGHQR
jgi:hypothetical protein